MYALMRRVLSAVMFTLTFIVGFPLLLWGMSKFGVDKPWNMLVDLYHQWQAGTLGSQLKKAAGGLVGIFFLMVLLNDIMEGDSGYVRGRRNRRYDDDRWDDRR